MPTKKVRTLAKHEIILTVAVTLTVVAGIVMALSLYNYFSNSIFEQNQTKLERNSSAGQPLNQPGLNQGP